VTIETDNERQQVTITDLQGKTVFSKLMSGNKLNIDTSNFKSGIYIIGVNTNQIVSYKKLIVK
jgi:hypothetical protein